MNTIQLLKESLNEIPLPPNPGLSNDLVEKIRTYAAQISPGEFLDVFVEIEKEKYTQLRRRVRELSELPNASQKNKDFYHQLESIRELKTGQNDYKEIVRLDRQNTKNAIQLNEKEQKLPEQEGLDRLKSRVQEAGRNVRERERAINRLYAHANAAEEKDHEQAQQLQNEQIEQERVGRQQFSFRQNVRDVGELALWILGTGAAAVHACRLFLWGR